MCSGVIQVWCRCEIEWDEDVWRSDQPAADDRLSGRLWRRPGRSSTTSNHTGVQSVNTGVMQVWDRVRWRCLTFGPAGYWRQTVWTTVKTTRAIITTNLNLGLSTTGFVNIYTPYIKKSINHMNQSYTVCRKYCLFTIGVIKTCQFNGK